eukprot:7503632-Prorocentrum_lima.AAC.1
MALMGWDPCWWRQDKAIPTHETMVSLAGNAFSAWAVQPPSVAGLVLTGLASVASATPPIEVQSGTDSGEDW